MSGKIDNAFRLKSNRLCLLMDDEAQYVESAPKTSLVGGIGLGHGEGLRDGDAAAVGDDHILDGTVAGIGGRVLDLAHHIHAGQDLAEDNVTSVQPAGLLGGDEELGSVGVLASVGHAQPTGTVVLQLEVLILEALAIDGASSGTIALGEVATLDHEVLDDAVELAALVAATNKLDIISLVTLFLDKYPAF